MARGGRSGVRGPNSALTEFLRTEGITEGFRRRQEESATASSVGSAEEQEDEPEEQIEEEVVRSPARATRRRTRASARVEEDVDEDVASIVEAGRAKRRRAGQISDGDDSNDSDFGSDDDSKYKKFGESEECIDCEKEFEISVYSRYDKIKKGYLCFECNEKLKQRQQKTRRNQQAARKKRKRVALALLDKAEVKIPSLQDICIQKITVNIDDVDVLGDIGQANMNKISKILSRNRSLNDTTISLFLHPDLKQLEFWDCSNVDSDSLNKIALYCPNLESLTLFMCGHLHNDNLKYYSTNLPKLSELLLNGPFLISDVMWQDFFELGTIQLSKFEIRNTHRFGNDSLISLLENFGKILTLLKFSRLDGLNSASIYELIPHYLETNKLTHLEISYPTAEDLVTDELLINILSITGESLVSLNVDGCINLTDKFLIDGIAKFCPQLTTLSMKFVDQVSNSGFKTFMEEYTLINSGGLFEVDLTKCTNLEDEAVYSLLAHSGHTLIELRLNSLYKISKDFWVQIFSEDSAQFKKVLKEAKEKQEELSRTNEEPEDIVDIDTAIKYFPEIRLPLMTTLDVGFVRSVDNEVIGLVGDKCSKLKILEVHGNNKCTFNCTTREGLLIIGRQSDSV